MMGAGRAGTGWRRAAAGVGAVGCALALLGAPAAAAEPDPADPADPAAPVELVVLPAEAADPALAAVPESATTGVAPQSQPALSAAPPDGVPHLPSPDNLPPGTTQAAPEGRTLGYLRDLWHAVRTQDVTGADALLLLTQRPMDARALPPAGVSGRPVGPPTSSAPGTADLTVSGTPAQTVLPAEAAPPAQAVLPSEAAPSADAPPPAAADPLLPVEAGTAPPS